MKTTETTGLNRPASLIWRHERRHNAIRQLPIIPIVKTTAKPKIFDRFINKGNANRVVKGSFREPVYTSPKPTNGRNNHVTILDIIERRPFIQPVKQPTTKTTTKYVDDRDDQSTRQVDDKQRQHIPHVCTSKPDDHRSFVNKAEDADALTKADEQNAFINVEH